MTITGGAPTTLGDNTVININSLFQPVQGLAGPANIGGLQEMCSIYNNAKVIAVKITATFMANGTQVAAAPIQPCRCGILIPPVGIGINNWDTTGHWQQNEQFIMENPRYAAWKHIQSFGAGTNQTVTVKKYMKLSTLFPNKAEFDALQIYDQPINGGSNILTANPGTTMGAYVFLDLIDGTAPAIALTYTCDLKFKWYCKFWSPKLQLQ